MERTVNSKQIAKKELLAIGFHYIADRPVSNHPDDWYLRFVLGKDENGKYATFLLNLDTGGLHEGHYDMSLEKATKDLLERR